MLLAESSSPTTPKISRWFTQCQMNDLAGLGHWGLRQEILW
jgi:hypothetical protein